MAGVNSETVVTDDDQESEQGVGRDAVISPTADFLLLFSVTLVGAISLLVLL